MEPCLEWDKARTKAGYGQKWRDGKVRYIHREVWEAANGPLLPGEEVLHSCDNPPCYLLAHLFKGSQLDNNLDCISKGRANKASKLSTEQRAQIIKRYIDGEKPASIAPDFRIHKNSVVKIVKLATGTTHTKTRHGRGRWSKYAER